MLHRNVLCAIALFCCAANATALDIGFEGQVTASASDNVGAAPSGEEIEGQIGYGQIGVFGEQKGTRVTGAFSGEISSQRRLDDPDASYSTITQFLGAAEFKLTPRAFTWYVGDILGGVRTDNGIQSISDLDNRRRNVFVTGPRFEYDIDSVSRFNARFLYVNQSEDDVELEALFNASAGWEVDTSTGNTWGLQFGNIYTDNPTTNLEGDFNRLSLAATWRRDRGRNSYEGQLGGTRYDTDAESINGLNARLGFTRQLTQQSTFNASLTRDLNDQTLNTIETLFADGTGLEEDGDGFFDDTRLAIGYGFNNADTAIDLSIGASLSEFRLLADSAGQFQDGSDQNRTGTFASASYTQSLSARTTISLSANYERQDFVNRPDEIQSVLGIASFGYQLTRSFELILGYRFNVSDGQRTIVTDFTPGAESLGLEPIDVIENRGTITLVWAPPSRASKDLTIELSSLLQ